MLSLAYYFIHKQWFNLWLLTFTSSCRQMNSHAMRHVKFAAVHWNFMSTISYTICWNFVALIHNSCYKFSCHSLLLSTFILSDNYCYQKYQLCTFSCAICFIKYHGILSTVLNFNTVYWKQKLILIAAYHIMN